MHIKAHRDDAHHIYIFIEISKTVTFVTLVQIQPKTNYFKLKCYTFFGCHYRNTSDKDNRIEIRFY